MMTDKKIVVVDVETTGMEPPEAAVCEFAAVIVHKRLLTEHGGRSSLVNPERPIPPEVRAIHHITDVDVVDAPLLDELLSDFQMAYFAGERIRLIDDPDLIFAAHFAEFDRKFLPQFKDRTWLCTYRLAMHLYPEVPGFSNQVLRYCLLLPGPSSPLPPHRALPDAEVTANLLAFMLREHSVEELLEMQDKPVLLRKIRFGMHSGSLWSDIPQGYLRWILDQDFDKDTRHTAMHYYNKGTK